MRDLEERITEWRRRLRAAGIKAPAVLDELESHLREDVERQRRAGVGVEPAFAAAVQRIGPASALKAEFANAGGRPESRRRWLGFIGLAFTGLIVWLSSFTFIECFATWGERAVAFAALAFILLAAFGWPRVVPFLPAISNKRKRIAVELAALATGIACATFFCQVILPHFENPLDRQIPAIGFWTIFPVAVFLGLACGLQEAARRQSAMTAS